MLTNLFNEFRLFCLFGRHGNRSDIVVATKCRFNKDNVWMPNMNTPNRYGLSRKHIIESVEESLSRLQTDYIDLYQVYKHIIESVEESLGRL